MVPLFNSSMQSRLLIDVRAGCHTFVASLHFGMNDAVRMLRVFRFSLPSPLFLASLAAASEPRTLYRSSGH